MLNVKKRKKMLQEITMLNKELWLSLKVAVQKDEFNHLSSVT